MKNISVLLGGLVMLFLVQGCAVYTPYGYGPSVSVGNPYPYYGYRPQYYGNYGWGVHHGWGGGHGWNGGGYGWGGHHGWGGGHRYH